MFSKDLIRCWPEFKEEIQLRNRGCVYGIRKSRNVSEEGT
jgi:hypothetical protein